MKHINLQKIIIFTIIIFTGISFVHANETKVLDRSGAIDDIRFEKENSFGKVFFQDKLLFDGIESSYDGGEKYHDKINTVLVNKLQDKIYLSICGGGLCFDYLVNNFGDLTSLSFGGKYGIDYLSESFDTKYLIGISYFHGEGADGTLNIYNLIEKKIGSRYLKNIENNLKSIVFENNNIKIFKKDESVEIYKISDFSKTSLQEDYDSFEEERLREEKRKKIINLIKKYYPYVLGATIVFFFIRFLKK